MAIVNFVAVDNSTIWDVVNNTYGSVDRIVKLMRDNGFANINTYPALGQSFSFDDTLIIDQTNNIQSNLANKKFATRDRRFTNDNNPTMIKYERVDQIEYVSNLDGTVTIPLPALLGLNARIVQVEKEIKPMRDADWAWNASSAVLTLLNGQTVDNIQTLFIIYAITITS